MVTETYIQDTKDEMVSLTKAQVPNYLVGSEFYKSLSADDEEEFCIPRKFLKPSVSVASGAELAHLFHTMKFWGVMSLPSNLIELLIFKSVVIPECEKESVRDVLLEFDTEYKLSQLYDTLPVCSSMEQRLHTAVECGRQDVLEHVIRVDGQVNAVVVKAAAEHGFFDLLHRITNVSPRRSNDNLFAKVCSYTVASRGHSECLRYVLENGCKKEENTCIAAAKNGHLACLIVALEHGRDWDQNVALGAAMYGHLDCLRFATEQSGIELAFDAAFVAAAYGHLKCLLYLLDQGVTPTQHMVNIACECNQPTCLQLLHERGAPWDVTCAREAAMRGSIACLQYLHDEGCEIDNSVVLEAAKAGKQESLAFLLAAGCTVDGNCLDAAAKRGHLECAKLLKKFNVPLDEDFLCHVLVCDNGIDSEDEGDDNFVTHFTTTYDTELYIRTLFEAGYTIPQCALSLAVSNGRAHCVEYLCAHKCCELVPDLTTAALSSPFSVHILRILRRHNCPWDENTCTQAARVRNLASLTFAHEHGCPWDAATTTAAIQLDGDACVKYALTHGCPISEDACTLAARRGLRVILQILHEHGGALTLQTCLTTAKYKYPDCLTYAVKNGAPVDASICAAAARAALVSRHESYISAYNNVDTFHMLQCARELGCSWDERTCAAAAANESTVKCLQYAHENGCPWDSSTTTAAARNQSSLKCLQYALEHGCPVSVDACELAASRGLKDALQMLHRYGCPLTLKTCLAAATSKYPDCLNYAVRNGAPVDASICAAAVSNFSPLSGPHQYNAPGRDESLHMLQCARKLRCPWDASTLTAAARADLHNVCRYALRYGCPCDIEACIAAVQRGHLPILQLLHEHGVPWDERVSQAAATRGDFACLRYCVENGCPISKATMEQYNSSS